MPRSSAMELVRNELVTCVIAHAESALKRAGIEPQKATSIAIEIADELIEVFGGQNITFPKECKRKQAKKEALIYSQFKGDNYRELAIAHDMTERGLRKLLTRAKGRLARGAKA